jgi:GntR family galactonate operon transcriptional repressor
MKEAEIRKMLDTNSLALDSKSGTVAAKRPRVHEEVIGAIAAEIVSGAYPQGQPLPRENDLCKRHGVSRTAVREALKVLESKNLVHCRPRVGTTVLPQEEWNILDAQVLEWLGTAIGEMDLVPSIIEARHLIEPAAAAFAARRATMQDIANIDTAWRGMAEANGDAKRFSESDVAFHEALLSASHNKIFHQFGKLMQAAVTYVLKSSSESAEDLTQAVETHGKLVEALRMRDVEGASHAAHAIIDQAERDIGLANSSAEP